MHRLPCFRVSASLGLAGIFSGIFFGASCHSATSPSTVTGYFDSVQALGSTNVSAVSHQGPPPAATTGPAVTVLGGTNASANGANVVTLQSAVAFRTVFLAVSTGSSAPALGEGSAVSASVTTAGGYMQVDLSTAVLTIPIGLTYSGSLPPGGFDLSFQVAGPDGAPGPVTTIHKSVASRTVELIGQVFTHYAPDPSNPPYAVPVDPVAGAIVSTTLDSRTATTDANGAFDLQTSTSAASELPCYTITITSGGQTVYSQRGQWGSGGKYQAYALSPPTPFFAGSLCGSSSR